MGTHPFGGLYALNQPLNVRGNNVSPSAEVNIVGVVHCQQHIAFSCCLTQFLGIQPPYAYTSYRFIPEGIQSFTTEESRRFASRRKANTP